MRFGVLAMAVLLLAGCIDTRTAPVEYGAQVNATEILEALNKPTEHMHATDIKVGEFVALRTTQDLAMGASFSVIGDTGVTITAKAEDSDRIVYSGVLHDLTYEQDGSYTKVSKEGEVLCASKTPCACGECSDEASSASKPAPASDPLAPSMKKPTVVTKSVRTPDSLKGMGYTSPTKLLSQAAVAASAVPSPTFHRFSTWKTSEPAPPNVRAEPNCLGIPNCQIDVYHVVFDEVFWDDPKGNRYHIEALISPSVPYLSRNLSTCQTVLVNIGATGSNILLKQCTNVFDFRFQQ